jgi:hypothetical protein
MKTKKPLHSVGWLGGSSHRVVIHEAARAEEEARMNTERTTEPTTAAMEAELLEVLNALPKSQYDGAAVLRQILIERDALAATNRALTEALRDTEAMLCRVLHEVTAMSRYNLLAAVKKCSLQARALLSGQPVQARGEELERLQEWLPVIEEAERQDKRWLKPMPEFPSEQAVFVWALKAQEELGELSAALLGQVISKDGRGDPLTECYQTIAVLMRVAIALRAEAQRG